MKQSETKERMKRRQNTTSSVSSPCSASNSLSTSSSLSQKSRLVKYPSPLQSSSLRWGHKRNGTTISSSGIKEDSHGIKKRGKYEVITSASVLRARQTGMGQTLGSLKNNDKNKVVPLTRATSAPIACRTRRGNNHSASASTFNSSSSSHSGQSQTRRTATHITSSPTSTNKQSSSTSNSSKSSCSLSSSSCPVKRIETDTSKKSYAKKNNSNKTVSEEVYEVESVLDVKQDSKTKQYLFLIKWKGYSSACNTWEPEHHLEPDLLQGLEGTFRGTTNIVYKPNNLSKTAPQIKYSPLSSRSKRSSIISPNISNNSSSTSLSAALQPKQPKNTPSSHDNKKMTVKLNFPSNASICSSSGVSSLSSFSPSPSPASSATGSASSSCPVSPPVLDSSDKNTSKDGVNQNEVKRLLSTLIPGKVVSIQDDVQGRKGVLVKWINHEVLCWVDYSWATENIPGLILDYYEAILVFA